MNRKQMVEDFAAENHVNIIFVDEIELHEDKAILPTTEGKQIHLWISKNPLLVKDNTVVVKCYLRKTIHNVRADKKQTIEL